MTQEHRSPDLRHADGRVPVRGRQQAGDLPQHLPGQRGLLPGRVRRRLRARRRLHPIPAGEEPTVRNLPNDSGLFGVFFIYFTGRLTCISWVRFMV